MTPKKTTVRWSFSYAFLQRLLLQPWTLGADGSRGNYNWRWFVRRPTCAKQPFHALSFIRSCAAAFHPDASLVAADPAVAQRPERCYIIYHVPSPRHHNDDYFFDKAKYILYQNKSLSIFSKIKTPAFVRSFYFLFFWYSTTSNNFFLARLMSVPTVLTGLPRMPLITS